MTTWNVGGLYRRSIHRPAADVRGSQTLVHVACRPAAGDIYPADPGKFFKEARGWKFVYGKTEGEFRGKASPSAL